MKIFGATPNHSKSSTTTDLPSYFDGAFPNSSLAPSFSAISGASDYLRSLIDAAKHPSHLSNAPDNRYNQYSFPFHISSLRIVQMTKFEGEMHWNGIDDANHPLRPVVIETIPPIPPEIFWTAKAIFDDNPDSKNNVTLGAEARCREEVIALVTLAEYLFFKPGLVAKSLIDAYWESQE